MQACAAAIRGRRGSVRKQAAHRTIREQIARDAAEDPFAEPGVPIAACHNQVGTFILHEVKQGIRHRNVDRPGPLIGRADAVAHEVLQHVLEAAGLFTAFAELDDGDGFGFLKERKRWMARRASRVSFQATAMRFAASEVTPGGTTRIGLPAFSSRAPGSMQRYGSRKTG